jgi:hypothetical protein
MPPAHVHFTGVSTWPKPSRWCVRLSRGSRLACAAFRIETRGPGNWIFFQMQKFLQLPWLVRRGRWRLPQGTDFVREK